MKCCYKQEYQDDIFIKKFSQPLTKCHDKFISELHTLKADDKYLRLINPILIKIGF